VSAGVVAERRQEMPVAPWLDQSAPGQAERADTLAALEAEADGGPPTGLRARRAEAGLVIEQRWLIAGGIRT
jgi:hypothetical protein